MFLKDKFQKAHMRAAEVYADLSSARRLHVGCVIVKNDTIIGIGYNGMPSGWDNNCGDVVTPSLPYLHGDGPTLKTKPEVLHAESNAIAKLARSSESGNGASLFVTCSPCLECAKLIYQSGIQEVFYNEEYRSNNGVEFLTKCNIPVRKLEIE